MNCSVRTAHPCPIYSRRSLSRKFPDLGSEISGTISGSKHDISSTEFGNGLSAEIDRVIGNFRTWFGNFRAPEISGSISGSNSAECSAEFEKDLGAEKFHGPDISESHSEISGHRKFQILFPVKIQQDAVLSFERT